MMLSRLQRAITTRADAEAYIDALLDCIERQRYPSPMMLQRAFAVISVLARADEADARNQGAG